MSASSTYPVIGAPSPAPENRVLPEQVSLLYRGALEALTVTLFNAVLLAYVQWPVIGGRIIVPWLAFMLAVTAARAVLVYRYWDSNSTNAEKWKRRYTVGALFAGMGWGSAGVGLYPADSLIHQVFLVFVLGGIAAGAVTVLAPRIEVFFAFMIPTLTPILVRIFLDTGAHHGTMGFMVLVFALALCVTAIRLHHTVTSTLIVRNENVALVDGLRLAHKNAENLNEDLTAEIRQREKTEATLRARTDALLLSQQHLRSLASELRRTEQRERQRLATQLHDNLAQLLVLSKMKLSTIQRDPALSRLGEPISRIKGYLDEALDYTRRVMLDLRPAMMGDGDDLMAAMQWAAQKVQRHGLTVSIHHDGTNKQVDEEVLNVTYQCVHELLFNVLKHGKTDRATVLVRSRGRFLRIVVRDHGVGFTVPPNFAPKKDGGFGLFNMSEQIHVIGGTLRIISVPHRGTWARLAVPLKSQTDTLPLRAEMPATPALRHTIAEHGAKVKILLADDHKILRDGLRSIINDEADLEVVAEASDGEAAVKMAHEFRPDVIVMDINMPTMSGIEATRHIKGERPDTQVIALSMQDEPAVAKVILDAGASAYLSKRGACETLVEAIRHCACHGRQEPDSSPAPQMT